MGYPHRETEGVIGEATKAAAGLANGVKGQAVAHGQVKGQEHAQHTTGTWTQKSP